MTDGDSTAPGSIGDLAEAGRRLGISALALWIGYYAIGGDGTPADVEEWLSGASLPSDQDHELLVQALNDRFTDSGLDHPVRYRRE